ncbi:MAG: hypothetical protein NTZ69_15945 [Bacteroidia bacterium]|nr:hypothetical protein [Bacteroidia bacterium]
MSGQRSLESPIAKGGLNVKYVTTKRKSMQMEREMKSSNHNGLSKKLKEYKTK